jgi:acetyltransferase-like isoleucine patch superfamily enzyme
MTDTSYWYAGLQSRGSAIRHWFQTIADRLPFGDRLQRLLGMVSAAAQLRGCRLGRRVVSWCRLNVEGAQGISLGNRVYFLPGMLPTRLACHGGGTITIGSETGFNYGASIEAFKSVSIGCRTMIASSVVICDRDGERVAPIVIGDEVWIAHGARIMPGVTIGDRAVISAGCVVATDVGPGMMAVGNPARAIPQSFARA